MITYKEFKNAQNKTIKYLKKAGMLETTRRGYYRITERGQQILRQSPPNINTAFLRQFPEFVEFQKTTRIKLDEAEDEENEETQTPGDSEIC